MWLGVETDHTHEILEAVRQGSLHMGIVPERDEDPHLSWTHLLDIAWEPWTNCRQTNTRALALWGIAHDDLDIVAG